MINAVAAALQRIPAFGRLIPLWLALTLGAAFTLSVAYGVGQIVFNRITSYNVCYTKLLRAVLIVALVLIASRAFENSGGWARWGMTITARNNFV